MATTRASFENLKTNVPVIVANYILLYGVGKKATDRESCTYYEWATGFLPSQWRALVRLTKTYGVTTEGLGKEPVTAI
jgi:hypothetical protein